MPNTASNPPSSPPRRRLTAEQRRRQIIDVALELFSQDGFGGTTTKAIAQAAGVSEAIIFRHFSSKEELYTAILEQKAAQEGKEEWLQDVRCCAARQDDHEVFRLVVSKVLEAYRRDPNFRRLLLYASLEGHEIARISNQRINLPVFEFLSAYVAERQEQGAFRPCEPGLVVFALAGMAVQYATTRSLLGMNLLESSDETVAETFADLLIHGLQGSRQEETSNG